MGVGTVARLGHHRWRRVHVRTRIPGDAGDLLWTNRGSGRRKNDGRPMRIMNRSRGVGFSICVFVSSSHDQRYVLRKQARNDHTSAVLALSRSRQRATSMMRLYFQVMHALQRWKRWTEVPGVCIAGSPLRGPQAKVRLSVLGACGYVGGLFLTLIMRSIREREWLVLRERLKILTLGDRTRWVSARSLM